MKLGGYFLLTHPAHTPPQPVPFSHPPCPSWTSTHPSPRAWLGKAGRGLPDTEQASTACRNASRISCAWLPGQSTCSSGECYTMSFVYIGKEDMGFHSGPWAINAWRWPCGHVLNVRYFPKNKIALFTNTVLILIADK